MDAINGLPFRLLLAMIAIAGVTTYSGMSEVESGPRFVSARHFGDDADVPKRSLPKMAGSGLQRARTDQVEEQPQRELPPVRAFGRAPRQPEPVYSDNPKMEEAMSFVMSYLSLLSGEAR